VLRLILLEPGEAGWHVDLSTMHGNLEEDLKRRDFTLDSLAVDLGALRLDTPEVATIIIDPLGGMDDIEVKTLRATGSEVFRQDGIRLMRAVRLAAEFGFTIEAGTEALVRRDCTCLQPEAGERIREELLRLMKLTGTDGTILYMHDLGLLTAVIPELAPSVGLEQHGEHQWDVFQHSARSVAALDFILRRGVWPYADGSILDDVPWDNTLEAHFQAPVSPLGTHRELCKLAAVLHDIAKPQTRTISKSGRLRFYGHPQEGAVVAEQVLDRLRFSSREKKLVAGVVRYHLRPVQMNPDEEMPTRRAVYRFVRDLGEGYIDTLFFSLADHLATRGDHLDLTNWRYHANIVAYVLRESAREASVLPSGLVDGYDLQREFGLQPGVRLGEILADLREAQVAGEVTSRDGAFKYAREMINRPDGTENLKSNFQ
jgi:poly(A) polymerase